MFDRHRVKALKQERGEAGQSGKSSVHLFEQFAKDVERCPMKTAFLLRSLSVVQ